MKVGVISDTHLVAGGWGFRKLAASVVSKSARGFDYLEEVAREHFKGKVDRIFHAGDIMDMEVIELLEEFAPVDAVSGNMDGANLRERLPIKKVIELEAHRIGLIHGWGSQTGILGRITKEFQDVCAIVFGHTHQPMNNVMDEILYFNPGSAIDKRFAPYRSIGILTVEPDTIYGEIIKLE